MGIRGLCLLSGMTTAGTHMRIPSSNHASSVVPHLHACARNIRVGLNQPCVLREAKTVDGACGRAAKVPVDLIGRVHGELRAEIRSSLVNAHRTTGGAAECVL